MKNSQGVEVYLKPSGDQLVGSRYHEELTLGGLRTGDRQFKSCKICLTRRTRFLAVIRFDKNFELYDAAAVRIKVVFGIGQPYYGVGAVEHLIVRASDVKDSQHVVHELKFLGSLEDEETERVMEENEVALTMQPYGGESRSNGISIHTN
jgi:hypothetical protein